MNDDNVSSSRVAINFCSYIFVNCGLPKFNSGALVLFRSELMSINFLINSTSAVTAELHPVPGDWYFYSNLLSDCHTTFIILAVRMAVKFHKGFKNSGT